MIKNAYYNGAYLNIKDVAIPLSDRSVYFSDAVYDACLVRNKKIFMPKEHFERLKRSATAIGLKPPDEKKLFSICERLISECEGGFYFLYIQLSGYKEERSHSRIGASEGNLLLTITPISAPKPDAACKLITVPDRRYSLCNIKTVNLLPAVLASSEAESRGADEAVFIRDGIVTECAHSNIHIIKNGALFTHPLDCHILGGITRAHLLSICKRLGIPYYEKAFTKEDLISADEILITSSSKLCRRVCEIDGKEMPFLQKSHYTSISLAMLDDLYSATI